MLSFEEIIGHFADKIHSIAPKEDVERGIVELTMNDVPVTISYHSELKGLSFEADIGFFLRKIPNEKLMILATQNYLGIKTSGSTLSIEENGVTLKLRLILSSGGSNAEYWNRFLQFLDSYVYLLDEYRKWPEFTPIVNTGSQDQTGSIPNYHNIQG